MNIAACGVMLYLIARLNIAGTVGGLNFVSNILEDKLKLYAVSFEHFAGCWLTGNAIVVAKSKALARQLVQEEANKTGTDIRNLRTKELQTETSEVYIMEYSE